MSTGRFSALLLVLFLAVVSGFYWIGGGSSVRNGSNHEATYDRVMRTQTLRCGYGIAFPFFMRDPNSGKFSGIFYDYTEALGAALHLKIDWAEETGWGDFATALGTSRIDAMCSAIWPNAVRSRQSDFVRPIFYNAIYAYARADDKRFDNNIAGVNDPSVVISTMDGEISSLIAASDFPQAKLVELPQLSNKNEMLVNIVTKKADLTFQDPLIIEQFNKTNSEKLKRIVTDGPIRVFGDTIAIATGEDKLRRMLDTATDELLASGQIEKILRKYEDFPGTMLRVAPSYKE